MKKILVTGGNGFIGTHLILKLLKNKKNKILNLDKFSYCSNLYLSKAKFKNLKNKKINLLNFNKLRKSIILYKPDIVFHLAAETHVDNSLNNPIAHYENNVKACLNLLTILKSEINKKKLNKNFKFIHIGTDEVYGDLPYSSGKSFNEDQTFAPNNPYSASKASAILILKTFINNFKFPGIVTNCVNNFGHYQFVEKFIPRSILTAKEKGIIEVYGSGKNIRSWISAKDHVDALIYLSKHGKIGETYNISSNHKYKNIDVAKKIKKFLFSKKITTKIKFVTDRLGHDRQYSISSKKINNLGWKSKLNFDEEIKSTVNWYFKKENLNYFKNFKKHLNRKGL